MKPIEYCLDEILKELVRIWNQPNPHDKLDAQKLLSKFEVPQSRHEFFKSLIKKLVKDGYAEILVPHPEVMEISDYENRTWLTAEGYYLIQNGGYDKISRDRLDEKNQVDMIQKSQRAHRRWMTGLTIILSVGTTVAAWYYAIQIWRFYHPCG